MKLFKNKEVLDRKIPLKNYIIVLVVSIIVIFLTLYLREFYLNYNNTVMNSSYLSEMKVNEITKNDFDFILPESSSISLYISKTGNRGLYNTEKRIYKEFEENELLDTLIYWNINDLIKNNEYANILKNKFPNIDIYNPPFLIIIKDGIYKKTIDINRDDFINIVKETFSY